jgi:hypothetical protein
MISRFAAIVATLLRVTIVFGLRNTRKDAKNFRSKIDGVPFHHFLVDFLPCTSCVSWAKGM